MIASKELHILVMNYVKKTMIGANSKMTLLGMFLMNWRLKYISQNELFILC